MAYAYFPNPPAKAPPGYDLAQNTADLARVVPRGWFGQHPGPQKSGSRAATAKAPRKIGRDFFGPRWVAVAIVSWIALGRPPGCDKGRYFSAAPSLDHTNEKVIREGG